MMKVKAMICVRAAIIAVMCMFAQVVFVFHSSAARADVECYDYDDCMDAGDESLEIFDYEWAVKYYEQACAFVKESELDECNDFAAKAWLNKGDVQYNAKDYAASIEDYANAVRLAPNMAKAYIYRGDAYKNNGDRMKAIADYEKALELSPGNADVYISRGNVYYSGGKYDVALEDFSRAVELRSDSTSYWYRGDGYNGAAKYDLAISDYTRAMELEPGNKKILIYRGDCYMFQGEYDKALVDYNGALEAATDEWKPAAYIAEIYVMKRDKDKAVPALKAALENNAGAMPDDEKGTLQLILDSLVKSGVFPEPDALKKQAEAAKDAKDNDKLAIYAYANFVMQPRSPEANYLLAESYAHIGWRSSAIRYYWRYMYLAPTSKLNNVVRNAIKALEDEQFK